MPADTAIEIQAVTDREKPPEPDSDPIAVATMGNDAQPTSDPLELVDAATVALESGDENLAFDLVRRAFRLSPKRPEVAFMMARLLGDRQRFYEAIDLLDQVAVDHPQVRLPALGQTADWLIRAGKWSEAEKRFLDILQQAPGAAIVHRNLAELYLRQGRRAQAVKHLSSLCRIGDIDERELQTLLMMLHPLPSHAIDETFAPIGELGLARNDIGMGDWEKARNRLESADDLLPEASALLGRIYAQTSNSLLAKWIVANPNSDHVDAWFAKGVQAANEAKHNEAIRLFAKCVVADQTDLQAYVSMSQSLQKIDLLADSQAVAARAALIRKTQRLGQQMAESTEREESSILDLAATLDGLKRPLEAIAWRGVALAYAQSTGTLTQVDIRRRLDEIEQDRSDCLATKSHQPDRSFLLVGVDPLGLTTAIEPSPADPNGAKQSPDAE